MLFVIVLLQSFIKFKNPAKFRRQMGGFRGQTSRILLFMLVFLLLIPAVVLAQENKSSKIDDSQSDSVNNVTVYFFWGEGCPHCEAQMPFMKSLEAKYPELKVVYLETWYNKTNAELFVSMAKAYKASASGVPATFIGDKPPVIGYIDEASTGKEIENRIIECIDDGCINPIDKLNSLPIVENISNLNQSINIPVIGTIDAGEVSLPLFTVIIAGLDSFNPCAFFVLLFLLSLLVYAGSRKRMLFVGGIFIFFSGLIYFLFMAAWLNIFLWTGEILWITMGAGLIAVIIALINIKDFFFFKKGVSLSISEKAKPKLFSRMRNLIRESSIWSLILGTVVLAVVANTYELLCTAGFPMVFTRMLTLNNLSTASYYLYLILYNLVYIIPLAIIVGVFTYTLGSRKLAEQEGKVLKLTSGVMMLMLGLALLFKPDLLNNVFASILMILLSVALSFVIVYVSNKIQKSKTKKSGKEE
jgi:thiol-disulfide isomerase/thioredoxin